MKNLKSFAIPIATLALLFAGCSKDKEVGTAKVHVSVSDFAITQQDLPQTKTPQDAADYEDAKAIVLAFYNSNGDEVYKTTQYKADPTTYTTFGEFECDLTIGSYTMVAVAYAHSDGDEFFLTSPTAAGFTSERPRETFCKTQSVTVTSSAPLDLTVTLNRIVSALDINSTDNRPAGIAKIRTTYAKGGKAFDPTTGLATSDAGFTQTNTPSAAVGAHIGVSSFPFLATDEEDIDVTIEVLDAGDNVLFTKYVPDVPMQRNRKTTLTGAVYSASASSVAFLLETTWIDGNTVNF
jgi:hypothetical protein